MFERRWSSQLTHKVVPGGLRCELELQLINHSSTDGPLVYNQPLTSKVARAHVMLNAFSLRGEKSGFTL